MKKRFLSWILVLTMMVSLLPSTLVTSALAADVSTAGDGAELPGAYTEEYNLADQTGNIEIDAAGTYLLFGTQTDISVKVTTTEAVTLVLNSVSLESAVSPLQLCDGAQVTLVVQDGTSNTLTCTAAALNSSNSGKTAGILVPQTAKTEAGAPTAEFLMVGMDSRLAPAVAAAARAATAAAAVLAALF